MLSLAQRCRTAIQEESIPTVGAIAGRVFVGPRRGVDDWDKVSSLDAGEAPRRSTSSLGVISGRIAKAKEGGLRNDRGRHIAVWLDAIWAAYSPRQLLRHRGQGCFRDSSF